MAAGGSTGTGVTARYLKADKSVRSYTAPRMERVKLPLGTPLATQAAVGVTTPRMVKGKTLVGDATFLAMSELPLL